jgi:hypothetical protein
MTPRTPHPSWPPAVIEDVADVLASTGWPGLTNSEITKLLAMLGIADLEAPNKRTRPWAALQNQQLRDGASNCIIRFITEAMAPGRHLQDQPASTPCATASPSRCPWSGCASMTQGKVARAAGTATTLDEVAQLAGRLRTEPRRRGVHEQVVRYCEEELLRRSLFHAVFEATKGVSDRLRQMTGLTTDGGEPAHTPRATAGWALTEPDALDLFSLLSLVHRRLDGAQVTLRP